MLWYLLYQTFAESERFFSWICASEFSNIVLIGTIWYTMEIDFSISTKGANNLCNLFNTYSYIAYTKRKKQPVRGCFPKSFRINKYEFKFSR